MKLGVSANHVISTNYKREKETTKKDVNDRYQDNVYTLPRYLISSIRLNPQTQTNKRNVTDRLKQKLPLCLSRPRNEID